MKLDKFKSGGQTQPGRKPAFIIVPVFLSLLLASCTRDLPPATATDSGKPSELPTPAAVGSSDPAVVSQAKNINPVAITFTAEPDLELDPNLNAPLAGKLTFQTSQPSRFELTLTTKDYSHKITSSDYKTDHTFPVLGLRPDREYQAQLDVYPKDSNNSALSRTLDITTDSLPDGFPNLKLIRRIEGKMEPGFTLFDIIPEGDNGEFGAVIAIVDSFGELVWYQIGTRYTDLRQLENGNILFIEGNKVVEMNMLGERVHEWKAVHNPPENSKQLYVNTRIFHHEVYPLEYGNMLSLSVEYRSYDNYPTHVTDPEAPKKTANVVGDLIIEFRPDGSIRRQWSLLDFLDPRRLGWASLGPYWDPFFNKKTYDWSHGNAVIYSPRDNAIIASSRHQDATIKFRRKNGELLWILSPHENWDMKKFGKYLLKPVNDQRYFFPRHSHSPEIMPNGNLLIYDNGNYRASPPDTQLPPEHNFSRAVEYRIDERKKEIELVWEYGQHISHPIFSGALGDADYLPMKNNVLITHGNIPDQNGKLSAAIIEVTHTTPGQEVFRLNVFDTSSNHKNGWRIYRSERIADLYGPETGVTISDLKRISK